MRSQTLENLGFRLYDSFHISCAEASQADVLLTTDDRLLKRVMRYGKFNITLSSSIKILGDRFSLPIRSEFHVSRLFGV